MGEGGITASQTKGKLNLKLGPMGVIWTVMLVAEGGGMMMVGDLAAAIWIGGCK